MEASLQWRLGLTKLLPKNSVCFVYISALSHSQHHQQHQPAYPAHYDGSVTKSSNGPVVLRRKKKQTSANLGKCLSHDYCHNIKFDSLNYGGGDSRKGAV